ncbi:MAG: 7-cyano-7-deazaguanine synthase, partial [Litorivicinaceae bacterium]
ANAVDYSGYPDCRPAFIEQFESLANVATAAVDGGERWVIEAPLMTMSKSDIVTTGNALGVDYSMTVSCYQADEEGAACGACDACRLRRKGFLDAGLYDPTKYRRGISPKI